MHTKSIYVKNVIIIKVSPGGDRTIPRWADKTRHPGSAPIGRHDPQTPRHEGAGVQRYWPPLSPSPQAGRGNHFCGVQ